MLLIRQSEFTLNISILLTSLSAKKQISKILVKQATQQILPDFLLIMYDFFLIMYDFFLCLITNTIARNRAMTAITKISVPTTIPTIAPASIPSSSLLLESVSMTRNYTHVHNCIAASRQIRTWCCWIK